MGTLYGSVGEWLLRDRRADGLLLPDPEGSFLNRTGMLSPFVLGGSLVGRSKHKGHEGPHDFLDSPTREFPECHVRRDTENAACLLPGAHGCRGGSSRPPEAAPERMR